MIGPKLNLIRLSRFGLFAFILISFNACSGFERAPEAADEPPFPPSDAADATTVNQADDTIPPASENYMENEIARLNTKVEALETKLASLDSRASEEAVRSAQPKLSAVASSDDPHANESLSNDQDPEAMESGNVSSRLATKLPPVTKMAAESSSSLIAGEEMDSSPTISGSVEKDFQASMRFFENGNYKEAANRFFAVSKEYKNHILASHALYWAGESAAKAKNWKIAISHFSNLETNYPRSVYMADALAGLANAYSASANPTKARHYQQVTTSAFPEVAATMEFSSTSKLSSAQPEGE